MKNVATFSPGPEQFCQESISHTPADSEVSRKEGGETGDFNLVSTSSNLKGRRGEEGDIIGMDGGNIIRVGNPEHNDSGEREGNKPGNGKLCVA